MRPGIISLCVIAAFLVVSAVGDAAEEGGFDVIFDHYEAVREALIGSTTDGVSEHATAIAAKASKLAGAFDAASAEVVPANAAAVESLLPEVREKALQLASAKGLDATREALAALTKPLTRWQKLVDGPRPLVVYCPMEKKTWLQPDGPVENPYNPSMLRCGEVVQR